MLHSQDISTQAQAAQQAEWELMKKETSPFTRQQREAKKDRRWELAREKARVKHQEH